MSRTDRTRRRFAVLTVAAFTLGLAGAPHLADAQTAEQPDIDQFGGVIASSRGNPLQVTYDSPNLLATGSPILQFSVPEALSTISSGPVGYALASFLFPGPLIADLDAALAASGQSTGIPPYPIRSESFYPSGPEEASQGEQGIEMVASTSFADSRARSSYAGMSLDPAAFVGGMAARSQSVIEGDQLVSRARSEISNFSVAGGLIAIESIVTDLVATSNGSDGATAGGTTVSGVTVLGLPATIDENGISFDDPPQQPDPENPIGGAIGGILGGGADPIVDALGGISGPLNDLLDQIGAGGDQALQQLFEQSGIEVKLIDPVESVDGGLATRSASGVSITMNYDGQNTPVFSDLLALVPVADLPSDDLGPIPFSPQALARLLEKVHTMQFAVGIADVSSSATPAFMFDPPTFETPVATPPTPAGSASGGGGSTGGDFASPTPELPAPASSQTVSSAPASTETAFPFGEALPALLVLAVVLGTPFLAAGSSRLADNALAPAVGSCPEGLDHPGIQEAGS